MTVFVSVVVVLVLGIVSFTRMTPDLLPNMDFPYVIIMTTYGGQTPETVETVVSKPLEQALSVVDGVKTVTSQSAENYSVIMIEFEDGTNMDSATVDVRSRRDLRFVAGRGRRALSYQGQSEYPSGRYGGC